MAGVLGSAAAAAAQRDIQSLNEDFGIGLAKEAESMQREAARMQQQAAQMINGQYTQMSTLGALTGGIAAATGLGITTDNSSSLFGIGPSTYQQWQGAQAFGPTMRWKQTGPDEWESDEYQESWTDHMGRSTAAPNRPPCPSCGNAQPAYKSTFDKHSEATGTVRFRTFHCKCGERFTDPENGMRLRINMVIEELRQRVRDFKI
jgi:hypothetical protein